MIRPFSSHDPWSIQMKKWALCNGKSKRGKSQENHKIKKSSLRRNLKRNASEDRVKNQDDEVRSCISAEGGETCISIFSMDKSMEIED